MPNQISESGTVSFTVKPKHAWDEKMSAVRETGARVAREIQEQGRAFDVQILAPREMCGDHAVPLSAVTLELDWKIAVRLEMVERARDIIASAYMLDSLDPALPTVLAAVIEGRGLFEHNIGEFFLLYGKFEQKHGIAGKETGARMTKLVKGDPQWLKPYIERGKTIMQPLPYAVRNILSHAGTNPNSLDQNGNDLKRSIDLLRSWV